MKRLEDIQHVLYQAAKSDRNRRFYTLHDKICRGDVLREAWRRVKENKGGPGIDSTTIESIDEDALITELQRELNNKTYRVNDVKRVAE